MFGVVSVSWYSRLDATRRRGCRPIAHLQQHAYAVGAAHHEREERHGVRDEVCASTRLHRAAACSQPGVPRSDEDPGTAAHVVSGGAVGTRKSRECAARAIRFFRIFVVGCVQTCAGGSAAEGGSSPRRVSMEAILEVRRLRPRRLAPRCGPHDRSTDEGPAREGSSKDLLGSAESAYESGSTASTTSHRPSSTRS